jgi:hypothetical protein
MSWYSILSFVLISTFLLTFTRVLPVCAAGPAAPSIDAAAVDGNWVSLSPLRLPATSSHITVYDPVRHRLLAMGGSSMGGDVWVLDPSGDPRWTRVPVANGPVPRFRPNGAYDAAHDRVLFFGGVRNTDVWALNLEPALRWERLDPAGSAPTARTTNSDQSIYDPVRDRVVFVRGGADVVGGVDVWALSLTGTPAWAQYFPSGGGPSGLESAAYDAIGDRMLLMSESLGLIWALDLPGLSAYSNFVVQGAPAQFRTEFNTTLDPLRLRVLLFGGNSEGGLALQDTWALTLVGTPTWSQLPGSNGPSARRQGPIAYDPDGDRMWVVGGINASRLADDDAWSLGLKGGGTWAQARTGTDARYQHAAVYDAARDRMVVFGGGTPANLNTAWQLPGGGIGLDVVPLHEIGTRPAPRSDFGNALDTARDRFVVFGGLGATRLNDTWVLSLDATVWAPLEVVGTPPSARAGHSMIYDSARDRMVVFGGSSGSRLNDCWELSLSGTPTWSPLATSGSPPEARFGHRAVYDPVRDRMLVFAGLGSALKNDVWALDFAAGNTWHQLAPSGSPPEACQYPSMIYDPLGDRVVVYGGKTSNFPSAITSALSLSPALSWTRLAPSGTPPVYRFGHSAVYDPLRDRMVVYGGNDLGTGLDDLWALYWTRSRSSGVPKPPLAGLSLTGLRPNPARTGVLFAEFALPDAAPARLELFDLAGRRVWAKDVGASGSGVHVLPVATERRLPVGLYVLRLTRGDRSLSSKGVVVE